MASVSKLKRKPRKVSGLEIYLFGEAAPPSDECAAERQKLCDELIACQRTLVAKNPLHALRHLRKMAHEYNPEVHGQSRWMSLLDNIDALRSVEAEMRKEAN